MRRKPDPTAAGPARPGGERWIAALVPLVLFAACEHPVRPANPTPIEVAAKHFGVPVSTILELQRVADRMPPPTHAPARPDPAGPEAQRLREVMAEVEKRYRPANAVTP